MPAQILDAIQSVAADHPEEAKRVIQQLRGKWETMSPEDREQAIAKLREMQGKLSGLTDEQRTEIAMAINSFH